MKYDGKTLAKASEILAGKRAARAAMYEQRREKVYAAVPRIAEIDRELSGCVADAIKAALSRGTDVREEVEKKASRSLELQRERAMLLRERGLPENWTEDEPACPECRDTGYIGREPCRCLIKLYTEELRNGRSGLMKLGEGSFEDFRLGWYAMAQPGQSGEKIREAMALVLDYCRGYAEDFAPGAENLFFTGETGVGKTFLSTSIARTVFERGFSVVYDTAADVFATFESEKFTHDEKAAEAVRRALECDLMILDDLGTEMTTSFSVSALYYLINSRLLSGRSMIISTNLSPEDIEKRYSPQIASRVGGGFKLVRFYGSDIRQLKKSLGKTVDR